MSAFQSLLENKIAVLDAVKRGAHIDGLRDPVVGPTDYAAISYPYLEVLPVSTTDQGGNEYSHTGAVNLLFERDRTTEYTAAIREVLLPVVTGAIDELGTVDCVVTYRPQTIEDCVGENAGTLLYGITVRFSVTTLVDLADS